MVTSQARPVCSARVRMAARRLAQATAGLAQAAQRVDETLATWGAGSVQFECALRVLASRQYTVNELSAEVVDLGAALAAQQ